MPSCRPTSENPDVGHPDPVTDTNCLSLFSCGLIFVTLHVTLKVVPSHDHSRAAGSSAVANCCSCRGFETQ